MEINEFIDTYADDVTYILEGRSALLTHPLRSEVSYLLDASACRQFAVFMIGSIEMMLKQWRDLDHHDILGVYFERSRQNGERIKALRTAFEQAGINVAPQVFDDYLAIKYLRNTIVHGAWKEEEKEWIVKCGFPTDTRRLTAEHFDRIRDVNENMMFYIYLTSVPESGATKPQKLIKLQEDATRQEQETGILHPHDLDRIIYRNLERVCELISRSIELAATSEQYSWTTGLTNGQVEGMSYWEQKRQFFLAARNAGRNKDERLARHSKLAIEALAFWKEYWQRAVRGHGVAEADIQASLDLLISPEFARLAAEASWVLGFADTNQEVPQELLQQVLGENCTFTAAEVQGALRTGRAVYDLFPNIAPVALLAACLPIVDPDNTAEYLGEARRAVTAARLNSAWYSMVEHHQLRIEDNIEFYDAISAEFLKDLPNQGRS